MKRMLIIYSVFIFLAIINTKLVNANEIDSVKIYIDGQVHIDTQVNGVSVDYNEVPLEISDVYIEVDDYENQKKYDYLECDYSEDHKYEFSGNIDQFSDKAKFIVNGRICSDELNIDKIFQKTYSKDEITNCSYNGKQEYSIEITSNDLKDIITYDVIFRSDNGGVLEEEQYNVEYINIIPGEKFPELPDLISNNDYNFIGWYDEQQKCYLKEFPDCVDQDYIITARWENIKGDENKTNETNMLNIEAYIPSTSTKENNIVLLIVSYIICLTVSV